METNTNTTTAASRLAEILPRVETLEAERDAVRRRCAPLAEIDERLRALRNEAAAVALEASKEARDAGENGRANHYAQVYAAQEWLANASRRAF